VLELNYEFRSVVFLQTHKIIITSVQFHDGTAVLVVSAETGASARAVPGSLSPVQ
jgi:hypothetical protein